MVGHHLLPVPHTAAKLRKELDLFSIFAVFIISELVFYNVSKKVNLNMLFVSSNKAEVSLKSSMLACRHPRHPLVSRNNTM